MSADKRKTILVVFSAVVAILAGVIAIVSPKFRSEDASGAIGAVQKHRAPQISKADVILTDEKTHQQQKTAYAGFLADAAALQNLSADLASAARAAESASKLNAVESALNMRQFDLQARFANVAAEDLASMRALAQFEANELGAKKYASMVAEMDSVASRVNSKLSSQDAFELASQMRDISNALGPTCPGCLLNQNLESVSKFVANRQLDSAANALANMNLDSFSLASRLNVQTESLAQMAKEMRVLANAGESLDALQAMAGNHAAFANAADEVSATLAVAANELESRAFAGMHASLASAAQEEQQLGVVEASLESMRAAANKAVYDSRQVQAFNQQLDALGTRLAARLPVLQSQAKAEAFSQAEALNAHMQNKSQWDSRLANLSIENRSFAEARMASRNTMAGVQAYLASLSAVENRGLESFADSLSMESKAQLKNQNLESSKK